MPTSLNCCWVFCNGIILYSHSNRKCSIIRTTHGFSAFIYLNTIKSWITFPHPRCCIGSLHFLHTLLLMVGGFSSHFSLGQPEITILKSLDWFIRCRRGVCPCGSSLDSGFLQVRGHPLMNSLKVTDGSRPDLTHYTQSKLLQVREPWWRRDRYAACQSCHPASLTLWRGWRE